jgi:hypothetical protein
MPPGALGARLDCTVRHASLLVERRSAQNQSFPVSQSTLIETIRNLLKFEIISP